jgi:hypothetical protein
MGRQAGHLGVRPVREGISQFKLMRLYGPNNQGERLSTTRQETGWEAIDLFAGQQKSKVTSREIRTNSGRIVEAGSVRMERPIRPAKAGLKVC